MDVPSKCTIVRAIGMTAYRLETKGVGSRDRDSAMLKTHKRKNCMPCP